MLIIPAVDLRGGKCVRLVEGKPEQETVYSDQPAEMALRWQELGAKWLHVVDLDGAFAGEPRNLTAIRDILAKVKMPVQIGGGIRTLETAARLLELGATRVIFGSAAILKPEIISEACARFGDAVVVGIDARDGRVAIEGWGQTVEQSALELAREMQNRGVKRVVFTDIRRDGTLIGPNLEATGELARATGLKVVASGGVSTLDDLRGVKKLERFGVDSVIIGKSLYAGTVDLKEALALTAKRVIPCLDLAGGRVVKGVNFVNLKDAGDPVELAAYYAEAGADEIVFLDITASHEQRKTLLDVVKRAASRLSVPYTVGGGISTLEDVQTILEAGAAKVSISTAAVKTPELIAAAAARFGGHRIVVAVDVKQTNPDQWEVYIHGGRTATGLDAVAWAKQVETLGAGEILLTSMDRDGTKDGYDLAATRAVSRSVGIPVVASGGVGQLAHLAAGLKEGEADAVLAASIFHFGQHTIKETKAYLQAQNLDVNL